MGVESKAGALVSPAQLEHYEEKGYLVLEDIGVPESVLDAVVAEMDPLYVYKPEETYEKDGVWYGGNKHPRIKEAWRVNANVKALATAPRILGILKELYGRRPRPFQTLNFPKGTQQAPHADSMHFSSEPNGYMCGVWIALEDIDMDNGPLIYYPGSHKLPQTKWEDVGFDADREEFSDYQAFITERNQHYQPYVQSLIEKHGLTVEYGTIGKGETLIWSSNLIHGGAKQNDEERTRHSQVSHYFFEGDFRHYTPMQTENGEHRYWEPSWLPLV